MEIDRAVAVLHGVADQVGEHLANAGRIPPSGHVARRGLDPDRARRVARPNLPDDLVHKRPHVRVLHGDRDRSAESVAGEAQQVVDNLLHGPRARRDARTDLDRLGFREAAL